MKSSPSHISHSLILLTFLWMSSSSCEGDYDIRYEFTGLEVKHAENYGENPEPTSADSIASESYAIRLNLFPNELSREGRYLDKETLPTNINPIDSVLVTSDMDFDQAHLAGSSLNDLFLAYNHSYFDLLPLSELVVTNRYLTQEEFEDQPIPEYVSFLMVESPDSSRSHTFHVKLIMLDGTVLEDGNTPVIIF